MTGIGVDGWVAQALRRVPGATDRVLRQFFRGRTAYTAEGGRRAIQDRYFRISGWFFAGERDPPHSPNAFSVNSACSCL